MRQYNLFVGETNVRLRLQSDPDRAPSVPPLSVTLPLDTGSRIFVGVSAFIGG